MCSAPSYPAQQQQAAQVTPAPAPAPAAPAPVETQIGAERQNQNVAQFGDPSGPNTRSDRSLKVSGSGTGLNM